MSAIAELTRAERQRTPLVTEVEHVRALLEAYRDGEPAPPAPEPDPSFESAADRLAALFGLSPFERGLLLLAAAVELDGEVAALVGSLQGGEPRPTFGLALASLPGAHWDALAPQAPLRRWRLVEPGPGPTLASRPLQLDERLLVELTGLAGFDERLDGVLVTGAGAGALAPSQVALAEELAETVATVQAPALVLIDGEDADAHLGLARELAGSLGRLPLVVRAAALPPPGPELARVARLIDREALLLDGLAIVDAEQTGEHAVAALLNELEASLVAIAGAYKGRFGGRTAVHRSVSLPSAAEQRSLWARALAAPTPALSSSAAQVAQHYRLGAAAVDAIARELTAAAVEPGDAPATLLRLCRERARVPLDGIAERIEPAATWDDLVLPEGQAELLAELVRHVRHRSQVYEGWGFGERSKRGLGISALFTGESGTGKTLAAEVIAHELKLDLYRIDLAATVSKYIGETEKNLRRLFDAAESSGAVLLFDEADALFGKRGEVREAHDRYSNIEIAYLLGRMEAYRGLAILTTNLRSNVDRAFLRRLRFVVQFPFPDVAQRTEIWRRAFPPATPLAGIEPERLARLTVPGGSIRAIALSAAFAAADQRTPVTPAHVLRAARIEYAKSDRALTDAETAALG